MSKKVSVKIVKLILQLAVCFLLVGICAKLLSRAPWIAALRWPSWYLHGLWLLLWIIEIAFAKGTHADEHPRRKRIGQIAGKIWLPLALVYLAVKGGLLLAGV